MKAGARWAVFIIAVLALSVWAAGMAFFHVHPALAALCPAVGIALLWLHRRRRRRAWAALLVSAGLAGFGWSLLTPLQDRDWADEVSRMPRYRLDGTVLTLTDVRDFAWSTRTDYDARWVEKKVDLEALRTVDVALSYWMGPAIAHTLVSFGFEDGQVLTFSVEIRKERHELFDALAGFFRNYEMALIVAEERDILRVRADVRGEQLYLYRVDLSPEAMQALLREYLHELDALHAQARFYNSLTANCTTVILALVRRAVGYVPLDWRILLSGYLDAYLYEKGRLDMQLPFEALKRQARVPQGSSAEISPQHYSRFIRE